MDWDLWIKIATIASPIIGAVAIVVALIVSRRSSRDAQRQIDVFMSAQAPDMSAALEDYQQQLAQIDQQIANAQQEYNIVNPFYGRGPRIDDIDYENEKRRQKKNLDQLKQQRMKIVQQIQIIESFLNKQ